MKTILKSCLIVGLLAITAGCQTMKNWLDYEVSVLQKNNQPPSMTNENSSSSTVTPTTH